jgi:hypothetical protein
MQKVVGSNPISRSLAQGELALVSRIWDRLSGLGVLATRRLQ